MRSARPIGGLRAVVAGLSVDQLVAWGVLYYAYSVLAVPMAADLGVSPGFVAAAYSGTLLVAALLARPVGRLLDRVGARPVLRAGALAAPAALVGLAVADAAAPLLLAFAGLGAAQALSLYEPAFRGLVDWFPGERARARALLWVTSVGGLASTLFLPLTALLVAELGWRGAVLVLGAVVAAVTLPVRWSLPVRRAVGPARGKALGWSPSGLRMLAAAFALQTLAATGVAVCLVWQLVERGEALPSAALLAGLAGASQVPGRLLLGPLQRRLGSGFRLPLLFVVQAAALAGLAVGSGVWQGLAVFFFGAANGMMTLERAAVVVEWFGRDGFGAHSGRIASVALLARAAAPFAVEVLRGSASYTAVFGVLALGVAAGGVAVGLTNRLRGVRARAASRSAGAGLMRGQRE